MGKNTITLDNFADFHGVVKGVDIHSDLPLEPYLPGSDINIHLDRIARAAQFSHMGSVTFSRYTAQEHAVIPGITDMYEDGTAAASYEPAVSQALMDPTLEIPDLEYTAKGDVSVKINFGHEEVSNINVREAQPWAQHINQSISESIRLGGNSKLLANLRQRLLFGAFDIAVPPLIAGQVEAIPVYYAAWAALLNGSFGWASMRETKRKDQTDETKYGGEYSLLPFLPLDRLGLVHAYTHARKFASVK